MLACDFETTVYDGQTFTEVWSAAYARLFYDKVVVLHSIEEFIQDMKQYRCNVVCWFHNERFDGTFIVNYLLQQGWTWKKDSKHLNNKEFSTLISKQSRWYTITISFGKYRIEIRDSAKLMPMTLSQMGEAFGTLHRKKEMEYKGVRYAGCSISQEEMEYIINDVLVLKESLEYMFLQGHTKLTIGSCALHQFKHATGKTIFEQKFPRLDIIKLDDSYGSVNAYEYIHKSYKGGWCYLKKEYANSRVYRGRTFDVNSLYSSVMHSSSGNSYPVGLPHFWKGSIPDTVLKYNRIFFIRVKCRFYLKEKHLPTIQIKGNPRYRGSDWLETSDVCVKGSYYRFLYNNNGEEEDTDVELTLTSTDWKLFNENYNIEDLEILDGCWFYSQLGLFDDYIERWMDKKMNAKSKAERTEAKFFLNNLYGKFGTSTDSSYREPVLLPDSSIDLILHEESDKVPGYIAIGSFVTSYAREFTIRHAQKNYDLFIYADTDSLHLKDGEYYAIKIHPSKLLHWKEESFWSSAIFLRQKTYAEFIRKEDGEKVRPHWLLKCAGMSEKAKSNFFATRPITCFDYGLSVWGNLEPKRIPGGIVLKDSKFTLRKR